MRKTKAWTVRLLTTKEKLGEMLLPHNIRETSLGTLYTQGPLDKYFVCVLRTRIFLLVEVSCNRLKYTKGLILYEPDTFNEKNNTIVYGCKIFDVTNLDVVQMLGDNRVLGLMGMNGNVKTLNNTKYNDKFILDLLVASQNEILSPVEGGIKSYV